MYLCFYLYAAGYLTMECVMMTTWIFYLWIIKFTLTLTFKLVNKQDTLSVFEFGHVSLWLRVCLCVCTCADMPSLTSVHVRAPHLPWTLRHQLWRLGCLASWKDLEIMEIYSMTVTHMNFCCPKQQRQRQFTVGLSISTNGDKQPSQLILLNEPGGPSRWPDTRVLSWWCCTFSKIKHPPKKDFSPFFFAMNAFEG